MWEGPDEQSRHGCERPPRGAVGPELLSDRLSEYLLPDEDHRNTCFPTRIRSLRKLAKGIEAITAFILANSVPPERDTEHGAAPNRSARQPETIAPVPASLCRGSVTGSGLRCEAARCILSGQCPLAYYDVGALKCHRRFPV
jgi:hypothetical protein